MFHPITAGDEHFPARGESFISSWSGGKDSCLAHYLAVCNGARPEGLITMFVENGMRSRSHGLARDVVRAQARSMRLTLHTKSTTRADYEDQMVWALREMRERGVRAGVFGDIDIEQHRAWEESVCHQAGMRAFLPLWQWERRRVLRAFWEAGFEARIVAVKSSVLSPAFLGRTLTPELVEEVDQAGVDVCGENGEFHTVVVDGPLFQERVELHTGSAVLRSGYWFLDLHPVPASHSHT